MWSLLIRMGRERRGTTAIEYAIIAGFIALVIVGSVNTLGAAVRELFEQVQF